jgi:hypothetical protein
MRKLKRPSRKILVLLVAYILGNVALYVAEPYGSQWHYSSRDPAPLAIEVAGDSGRTLDEIRKVLDAIDLAYKAREPTAFEYVSSIGVQLIQIAFLPSTLALMCKQFIAYIGPPNTKQRAFTVSVKRRYNHLARLAVRKGMQSNGFLYLEEWSLRKENGQSFDSLREAEK